MLNACVIANLAERKRIAIEVYKFPDRVVWSIGDCLSAVKG